MTEANPYVSPTEDLVSEQDLIAKPTIFSMTQRIGRIRYLAYSGVSGVILYLVAGLFGAMDVLANMGSGTADIAGMGIVVFILCYLLLIFVSIVLGVRRLHDLDKSGWFYLLNLVPFVNIGMAIYMIFFPGSEGANRFGPKTAPNTVWNWIAALVFPLIMIFGVLAAVAIPAYQDYVERAQQYESQN